MYSTILFSTFSIAIYTQIAIGHDYKQRPAESGNIEFALFIHFMEGELLLWARRIIFLCGSFWVCNVLPILSFLALQKWPIHCNLKGRTDQSSYAVDTMLYGQAACLAMNNFVTKMGPLIPLAPTHRDSSEVAAGSVMGKSYPSK